VRTEIPKAAAIISTLSPDCRRSTIRAHENGVVLAFLWLLFGAILLADCVATTSLKDSIPMNNLMRVHT